MILFYLKINLICYIVQEHVYGKILRIIINLWIQPIFT